MPLRYRMSPRFWFTKPAGLSAVDLVPATIGLITFRLTVNGRRTDLATGVKCAYKEWDAKAQRLRGTSDRARQANARLGQLLDTAQGHYYALERGGLPVTCDRLRQLMAGGDVAADETLLAAWDAWGQQQRARYGAGEIVAGTAGLAVQRRPLVVRWLGAQRRLGLLSRELTPALVRAFRLYLLSPAEPRISSLGYASKTARLLAEACAWAVERGALAFHPCPKLKLPSPPRPGVPLHLSAAQLALLTNLPGLSSPLSRTRDGFLLQCHTGLAWADARALRPEHISSPDAAGRCWLRMPRQKTGTVALVPLLPEAAALLAKYAPKPVPVCANQLYNARLKLLGERLGLAFPLTSHVGRKTFAMLAVGRGVSLDSVAAMLGHTSLQHTALYAQVREERVGREMTEAGLL